MLRLNHSKAAVVRQPRDFPSTGFERIDSSQLVEEERLPFYRRHDYYPMCIGQLIHGRYQVVAKLGYGTTSTVWLSRDLRDGKFWVLKVHVNTLKHNQEMVVYKHLSGVNLHHGGRQHVRQFQHTFTLNGLHGDHDVFVMPPLGMSLRTFQDLQKDKVFQCTLVTAALDQVLLGLNYLHNVNVIHTDMHSDNLLIALTSDMVLSTVEDNELHRPSARKYVDDTVIHVSQYMLGGAGNLTICDLGQARIGEVHRGNAMPVPYRAPEAWDLLYQEGIFRIYDQSEELNDAHHLAAMTALLGPPPDVFLRRSDKTSKYWNEKGQWHGPVPFPSDRKIQYLKTNLSGEDRDSFLDFLAGVLTWLPGDRLSTFDAYFHPLLRGESTTE
ncbi:hypothetical protein HYE67_001433 [Fusarium culmorum]|uniref:non-specific serine/threonine protein kinase n=1 Tax=Fusarium culmorum TaxID=5516 RepID=A0A7S8HRY9_FUSCU|nr:hypothetical protein HYE67_001433 [Fusarium culmorum]